MLGCTQCVYNDGYNLQKVIISNKLISFDDFVTSTTSLSYVIKLAFKRCDSKMLSGNKLISIPLSVSSLLPCVCVRARSVDEGLY